MPRFINEDGSITFGPEAKEKPKYRPERGQIPDWNEIQRPKPGHISYAQLVGYVGLRESGYKLDDAREIVVSPSFFEHLAQLEITTVTALIEDFTVSS